MRGRGEASGTLSGNVAFAERLPAGHLPLKTRQIVKGALASLDGKLDAADMK